MFDPFQTVSRIRDHYAVDLSGLIKDRLRTGQGNNRRRVVSGKSTAFHDAADLIEHISPSAGPHPREHRLRVVEHRYENDAYVRVLLQDLPESLYPADERHLYVHQNYVGHLLPRLVYRLLAGRRFSGHLDVRHRLQDGTYSLTEQRVIVSQQDPNGLQLPPLPGVWSTPPYNRHRDYSQPRRCRREAEPSPACSVGQLPSHGRRLAPLADRTLARRPQPSPGWRLRRPRN